MSAPEDWCREKLENLQIKDKQKDTLTEIKQHLTELPSQQAIITSNFLQLPAIFDCLDDGGRYVYKIKLYYVKCIYMFKIYILNSLISVNKPNSLVMFFQFV